MRNLSYWLCFSLVVIPFVISTTGWLLAKIDINLYGVGLLYAFEAFGSLIPALLSGIFPNFIHSALALIMLTLVIRRGWLLLAKRSGVPPSFQGVAKILAYIGTMSFCLGLTALVISAAFRLGSGIPAGLLMIPAAFCLPWAFFLTEVQSFRVSGQGEFKK